MRILFAATIAAACSISASAQHVSYTVDLRNTNTKEVAVTVDLKGFHSGTASYQMPVWAPGAYSVTNYGRFVKNFKALDKNGTEISATKVDENRWEIKNAANLSKFTYSVINSYKDSTSLYFAMCHIDTNFVFANATALFGYVNDKKDIPSDVIYLPDGLRVYCPLPEGGEANDALPESGTPRRVFHAKNYDELADAPVMAGKDLQYRTFNQSGAVYDIAVASDQPFPMDSLAEVTKKIVKAETDFFGDTPFKKYIFLINAPSFSHVISFGMGALEHANSSGYLLMNISWSAFKELGVSTLSHEFFHLWNVKRIHSDKLGPFDYQHRVKTTSLWLSEGVTDYYANTLLTRTGIMPPEYFEKKIAEWMGEAQHSKSAKNETLEQLSIDESDFDITKAMSFYTKGPLVAMMLDVEIRTRTNNKKSLDDVMRTLYAQSKKGKHFKDEELIGTVEKIVGLDLTDFYHRYIAGTDSLPMASYMQKMGLMKDFKNTESHGVSFRTRFLGDDGPPVIDTFFKESSLPEAGLTAGDTILTFNGKKADKEMLDEFSLNNSAPQTVTFEIARNGARLTKTVTLPHPRTSETVTKNVAPADHPAPLERAIRRQIYGG